MIIVGIGGGTGSGKTTFAKTLRENLGGKAIIISQDSYYAANSELSLAERRKINYDHPSAFEDDLLVAHLKKLRLGESVAVPIYDFEAYTRTERSVKIFPQTIILVEGILVLANAKLREQFDIKVYVDTDPDVRLLRRLVRDVEERGRTLDSVRKQYLKTVKPMHEAFVEPSKKYADLIVPEGGFNTVALETLGALLKKHLREKTEKTPLEAEKTIR